MKTEIDNLNDAYKLCKATGRIREKIADIELAKSLKLAAEKGLDFIKGKSKGIPRAQKAVAQSS